MTPSSVRSQGGGVRLPLLGWIALLALVWVGWGLARMFLPALRLHTVDERIERKAFGAEVRRLLQARRFDALDALADSLQRCDCRFASGESRLRALFRFGFKEVGNEKDPAEWEEHLARLREWQDAHRQSRTAGVALALALIGRGWASRGKGYAQTVSARGWRGFQGDLYEAGAILRQCRRQSDSSPGWYEATMDVLHGLAADDSLYDAAYREGVARFPTYARFYLHKSWHLQPRWFGRPGDWERFAAGCAPDLPDSVRDEIYARIVVFQSSYVANVFRESHDLSWPRLQRGLELWRRRYPKSVLPLNALAMLAYWGERRVVAYRAFVRLGDTVDLEVWGSKYLFLFARAWAGVG